MIKFTPKIFQWVSILIGYYSIAYFYNLYQNKNKTIIINESQDTEGT
jgi:hypothetical protein